MTLKALIEQVAERVPDIIENQLDDWGALKQIANEAMQRIYAVAVNAYPGFYTKQTAINNTASLNLPADFYQAVTIRVPTAMRGGCRIVDHRKVETMNRNQIARGEASQPIAVIEHDSIKFTPAVTGTLFYLWTFGFVSDEDTELTDPDQATPQTYLALIPSIFEEEIVLLAVDLVRERYEKIETDPSQAEQSLQAFTAAMAEFERQRQPDSVYKTEVATGG